MLTRSSNQSRHQLLNWGMYFQFFLAQLLKVVSKLFMVHITIYLQIKVSQAKRPVDGQKKGAISTNAKKKKMNININSNINSNNSSQSNMHKHVVNVFQFRPKIRGVKMGCDYKMRKLVREQVGPAEMNNFQLIFLVTRAREVVQCIRLCLSAGLITMKNLRNGSLFFFLFFA